MKDYTVLDGQITCLRNKLYDEAYKRGYEDGQEYEQLLRTPKHDADRIEQIKDLIRECDKINAYTFSYPAWRLINKLKKIVGWQLEDYEEPKNELTCDDCEQDCDDRDGLCVEFKRNKNMEKSCSTCKHYKDDCYPMIDCHSFSKWEQMRKESEYHADPYHADFAWDVKTVVDNLRKESE